MRRVATVLVALVLGACGGGGDDVGGAGEVATGGASADSRQEGGAVIDRQPPGEATVRVDGREYTLTERGGADCAVEEDGFRFSFISGNNEVVLGGSGRSDDGGWEVVVRLEDFPEDQEGGITFFFLDGLAVDVGIDGNSVSMVGQMEKYETDPTTPDDVGEGVISFTCP